MTRHRWAIGAAAMAGAVLLGACGSSSSSTATTPTSTKAGAAASAVSAVASSIKGAVSSVVASASSALAATQELDGTWKLGAGLIEGAANDVRPTITFKGNEVSGFTGCNSFTTTATIASPNITFAEIAMNKKACGPVATKVENEVLSRLAKVKRYVVAADRVAFGDGSGGDVLVYTRS